MKTMTVKIHFTEDVLGTASNNPEIHAEFIAANASDAESRREEIDAIGIDGYREKNMTIFPKDADGHPFFWDYQIRGFFKDSCAALQRCKGEDFSKESCKMKAYKKVIDGCIFVGPRKIPIKLAGPMGNLQRPLRGQTAQGERIALADSETIPAGSEITIKIDILSGEYEGAVREWLNYGVYRGIGQWRNASWGRFTWKEIKG